MGCFEEAIKDYTTAIDINPSDAIYYYNRGYIILNSLLSN